jgi:predicted nucleic acid-binding protein
LGPVYFDSSALVPLVIAEPATPSCTRLWDDADVIVSSSLAYVEVHAALAQAMRQRRIDERGWRAAVRAFEARWEDVVRASPHDSIIALAATLAASHGLRGYDAVHCATAVAAASDDFVAVSGDRDLLRAWSELGLVTVDTRVAWHP